MTNDYIKLPIMVVEDYQPSMSLLNALLGHKGFKKLLLMVGKRKVLSYLEESNVAAIILDLSIPVESGIDLVQLITANRPEVPIIIVTDPELSKGATDCLKLGAFEYLTKPISVDRLADSIKKALDLRCLNEVASLLRHTPCIIDKGMLSHTSNDSAPVPFVLPEEVPERLRKAVDYMDLNLSKPLTLERIADKASLSKYHFSREFKRYIGMSPIQFMMNRRICQATMLLQNTELSISSVAIRSGFSDQSEFTKWFKRTTGFTPSWYRKSFSTKH